MTRYAMFLRGINVGGVKVPMADLKVLLGGLGLDGVRTWLQTGNVCFDSDRPATKVQPEIEVALTDRFGYQAHVILLNHNRLAALVDGYPFVRDQDHHAYAMLCADDASTLAIASLPTDDKVEQVSAGGGVVYWRCPKGATLDTVFSKASGKPRYRATTTTRNLNTLEKLL